ncbi:uncharacterized protein EI90DRAFT_1993199 [Cantharellus anzutake]|uniref:uncharacterized protein n=1 Tax=Cantharellus anzutake TaxID=1750568 RepID=UPI001903A52F|nr:uncharacterized protein EI90DRAFT_1993199 [Cantharellus anzutake]KAF8326080.1 hypothetical protein EI90DRAFT_1993199 [Cantharellus anzutake]
MIYESKSPIWFLSHAGIYAYFPPLHFHNQVSLRFIHFHLWILRIFSTQFVHSLLIPLAKKKVNNDPNKK